MLIKNHGREPQQGCFGRGSKIIQDALYINIVFIMQNVAWD